MMERRGSKEARRGSMFSLIEQREESDQGQKEFCQQQSIALSVFRYWLKKNRKAHCQLSTGGFIPVHVYPYKRGKGILLEIFYPNGMKIILTGSPDINTVKILVELY